MINHDHTTRLVTNSSSQLTPVSRHATPLLRYSKLSDKIASQKSNLSLTKSATTLKHSEPNPPENLEDNHANVTEGNAANDRGTDSYDGEEFESDYGSEEGSEVDVEGGRDSRGGERSDVEADRHDKLFSDTQEMDSSITNQYLRQLRCVMSYLATNRNLCMQKFISRHEGSLPDNFAGKISFLPSKVVRRRILSILLAIVRSQQWEFEATYYYHSIGMYRNIKS